MILSQHLYISPFVEESVDDLAEVIDPGHILFGSDWPHPEGLARSLDFREGLADFDADSTKSIMGDITEVTMPAIEAGLATACRARAGFQVAPWP